MSLTEKSRRLDWKVSTQYHVQSFMNEVVVHQRPGQFSKNGECVLDVDLLLKGGWLICTTERRNFGFNQYQEDDKETPPSCQ